MWLFHDASQDEYEQKRKERETILQQRKERIQQIYEETQGAIDEKEIEMKRSIQKRKEHLEQVARSLLPASLRIKEVREHPYYFQITAYHDTLYCIISVMEKNRALLPEETKFDIRTTLFHLGKKAAVPKEKEELWKVVETIKQHIEEQKEHRVRSAVNPFYIYLHPISENQVRLSSLEKKVFTLWAEQKSVPDIAEIIAEKIEVTHSLLLKLQKKLTET